MKAFRIDDVDTFVCEDRAALDDTIEGHYGHTWEVMAGWAPGRPQLGMVTKASVAMSPLGWKRTPGKDRRRASA